MSIEFLKACNEAAHRLPWERACAGRAVFTDSSTSLSAVKIPFGDSSRSEVKQIITIWKQNAQKLREQPRIHDFSYIAERVTENICDDWKTDLIICGSQQHAVQGVMLSQHEKSSSTKHRAHMVITELLTNPANLSSTEQSTSQPVKGVGKTCIHYMEQWCRTSEENYHAIHTCALFGAKSFYSLCGFREWTETSVQQDFEIATPMGDLMIRERMGFDSSYREPSGDTASQGSTIHDW